MLESENAEKIFQKRKNGDLGNNKKGKIRKLRKESRDSKRYKDADAGDPIDVVLSDQKKPEGTPINKLKKKLEREAMEAIKKIEETERKPKLSDEESAEKLVNASFKEDIFRGEDEKESVISSVPAVQKKIRKPKNLGAAATELKERNSKAIPLKKSNLEEKREPIPPGKSSLEKKDRKKEYFNFLLQNFEEIKQDIFDEIHKDIENGTLKNKYKMKQFNYDEKRLNDEGKKKIEEEIRKTENEIQYYIKVQEGMKIGDKEKKSSAGKKKDVPYPTQKIADEFEVQPKTFYNNGKDFYTDGSLPDDVKEYELREENMKKMSSEDAKEISHDFEADFGKKREEKSEKESRAEEISKEFGLDTIKKGERIALPELIEGEAVDEKKNEQERAEKIKEFEEAVAIARKNFAEKDYEVTTALDRLKGFFGRSLKTDSGKIQDTETLYEEYKKKINDLLEFKLEILKEELAEVGDDEIKQSEINKKIGEVISYFNKDEKINLYEARTNARAEARKDKLGEKFFQKSAEVINWWRKLPLKYKIPVAAAIFVGGGGLATVATLTGFSAASLGVLGTSIFAKSALASTVLAGYKGFSGIASGTGVSLGMEAFSKRGENKKSEKFTGELMNESEKSDDKFQNIMDKLKDIDYRDSLRIEQNKSARRIFAGAAVAGVVGSGALSFGMKKLVGLFGHGTEIGGGLKPHEIDTHKVSEGLVKDMNATDKYVNDLHSPEPIHSILENQPASGNGIGAGAVEQAAGKISDVVEVKKGDSVWKIVDQKLQEHYGAKFNDLDPAKKNYIIDALKDRVSHNPQAFGLENADQLQAGQKIDLSEVFNKEKEINNIFGYAENLSQADMDNIHAGSAHIETPLENPAEAHPGPETAGEPVAQEPEVKMSPGAETLDHPGEVHPENVSENQISGAEEPHAKIEPTGGEPEVEMKPGTEIAQPEISSNGILGNIDKEIASGAINLDSISKVAIGGILTGTFVNAKNWNIAKDLTFPEAENNPKITKKVRNNLKKLYAEAVRLLGSRSRPIQGEKLFDWITRVAKTMTRRFLK